MGVGGHDVQKFIPRCQHDPPGGDDKPVLGFRANAGRPGGKSSDLDRSVEAGFSFERLAEESRR